MVEDIDNKLDKGIENITFELLSKVLKFDDYKNTYFKSFEFKTRDFSTIKETELNIYFFKPSKLDDSVGNHSWDWYNLDTLSRIMKEWARDNGYLLCSGLSIKDYKWNAYCSYQSILGREISNPPFKHANTEFESILKVVLYIFNKKKL